MQLNQKHKAFSFIRRPAKKPKKGNGTHRPTVVSRLIDTYTYTTNYSDEWFMAKTECLKMKGVAVIFGHVSTLNPFEVWGYLMVYWTSTISREKTVKFKIFDHRKMEQIDSRFLQ